MTEQLGERFKNIDRLFALIVLLPTAIASLYFGLLASDVYISESRFVVRSPEKPATTGLGVILKSVGFANSGDELFAAQEFITSRDSLALLNRDNRIANAYGNSSVSLFDRFNPLGINGTFEDLYRYMRKMVLVQQDATTSIMTLQVKAYSAQDAQDINRRLLEQSEDLVNRLNQRGRRDLIQYAEAEVAEARGNATKAAIALAEFRDRSGIIDPERQATIQLQMISKLQDELIATRTQLYQLQSTVPGNPQIGPLKRRIESLHREIEQQMGSVAGANRSLSSAATRYQRLALERELADRQLSSALGSLQEARNDARRKQAYVERIVQPNLPDEAVEPRRIRSILASFALALIFWGVIRMLIAGVREHQS